MRALLSLASLAGIALAGRLPVVPEKLAGRRIDLTGEAHAQFNFSPYELTNACFDCTRPNATALFACDIKFEWFDPNSVKENNVTACNCSYSWEWDGVTTANGARNTFDPEDFSVCYKSAPDSPAVFEMRINGFTSPSNLTLLMSHYYKDSSLWGAPYLYAQTWAQPQLNLTMLRKDDNAMTYYLPGPILANITGLDD